MRSFLIAVVTTALVAGLGLALAPKPSAQAEGAARAQAAQASAPAADSAFRGDAAQADPRPAAPREDAGAEDAGRAASPGRRVFYQWIDERGSVRFAPSLDDVPPEWRERAGQVEIDASRFEAKPARRPAPSGAARPRPFAGAAAAAEPRRRAPDVTIYTAPWCGWCRKTIAFLDQRGVDYVNKDIEADEEWEDELIEKSGGKSIPFVEIDGTQIRGYNPRAMAALLE